MVKESSHLTNDGALITKIAVNFQPRSNSCEDLARRFPYVDHSKRRYHSVGEEWPTKIDRYYDIERYSWTHLSLNRKDPGKTINSHVACRGSASFVNGDVRIIDFYEGVSFLKNVFHDVEFEDPRDDSTYATFRFVKE